jgi:dihydroxy-acid dehydratase
LNVKLTEQELKKRSAAWKPKKPKITKGYLARYSPTPME